MQLMKHEEGQEELEHADAKTDDETAKKDAAKPKENAIHCGRDTCLDASLQ